jgi:hypothetical protein
MINGPLFSVFLNSLAFLLFSPFSWELYWNA